MTKPRVFITHWRFVEQYVYTGMKAVKQTVLFGIPANHPSEKNLNCKMISSSRVIRVNVNMMQAETNHTIYKLVGPKLDENKFKEHFLC